MLGMEMPVSCARAAVEIAKTQRRTGRMRRVRLIISVGTPDVARAADRERVEAEFLPGSLSLRRWRRGVRARGFGG